MTEKTSGVLEIKVSGVHSKVFDFLRELKNDAKIEASFHGVELSGDEWRVDI